MRVLSRRLLHSVVMLIGVSVLSFAMLQLAPSDFWSELKLNPRISAETVAGMRAQYGWDRPLLTRYGLWLKHLAHGDFGFSFAYNVPAQVLLYPRARNTLLLTVTAALLSWLIALPLGMRAALRAGGWFDRAVGWGSSWLLAWPELTVALVLLILAVRTRLLPAGGMVTPGTEHQSLLDVVTHMVLPVAVITAATVPILTRHVRSSMLEVLDSGFMQAARSHGLPAGKMAMYALRAAANPLISFVGFSVATLLSSSLVVEVIMSWPGLGPLLVEATLARDLYVVAGGVLLSAMFVVAGNCLADVLLYAADPRIRRTA